MNTVEVKHANMVRDLVKDPRAIKDQLTSNHVQLIHMIMGIAGETGELLDAVKKHVMYGKPLDIDNVVEELGDIEFYLAGLRQELGIGRLSILNFNYQKLSMRYPEGSYSDAAAINRADKAQTTTEE